MTRTIHDDSRAMIGRSHDMRVCHHRGPFAGIVRIVQEPVPAYRRTVITIVCIDILADGMTLVQICGIDFSGRQAYSEFAFLFNLPATMTCQQSKNRGRRPSQDEDMLAQSNRFD